MASEKKTKIPENMSVEFIGAGRMAQAMAKGFISAGVIKAEHIFASDTNQRMLHTIQKDISVSKETSQQKNVHQIDDHTKLLNDLKEQIKIMEAKLNSLTEEQHRPIDTERRDTFRYDNRGRSYRGYRNNSTFRGRGGYHQRNDRFYRGNRSYEPKRDNTQTYTQQKGTFETPLN
ncbi:hypothetical protein DPMN_012097 [Dreissena polymorpha]|uniref:Pyrroline-5-carboxylate reductase catalytic N-terminal domain-containing protein n=1 Tax=Dreissena polymorpha TaxID=45954 RepID=A0A9D4S0M2_DREPO|nr:hypothetical protein DPMN_012097 [Dreissena polymorpha]